MPGGQPLGPIWVCIRSMKDGMAQVPQAPGLGITLSEEVKNKYPFIPGSGEFNDVPGKKLREWDARVAEQYRGIP